LKKEEGREKRENRAMICHTDQSSIATPGTNPNSAAIAGIDQSEPVPGLKKNDRQWMQELEISQRKTK
jgi:hypothetical protein